MIRVGYVYDRAADDVTVQSGRPSSIHAQLARRAIVEPAFPLSLAARYWFAPKYLAYRALGQTYRTDREPAVLRSLARQAEARLAGKTIDWIFAPGSHVLTYLEHDAPKLLCADATFANVVDAYAEFSNCSADYLRQGHAQEARALGNAAAIILPSDWAARTAIETYGAAPEKVHVMPFGANVAAPDAASVEAAILARNFDRLTVLFMGRDWERKGGALVLEACRTAWAGGVPLTLHIVGPERPPADLPEFSAFHGLLNKNVADDRARIAQLFQDSHVLFVPSRAENFGMTFCEAAAHGMPSLTTAVGGIPTIVREGISGWALPLDSDAGAYAEILALIHADPARYHTLAARTRQFYDANLTWDAFGDRLMAIFNGSAKSSAKSAVS